MATYDEAEREKERERDRAFEFVVWGFTDRRSWIPSAFPGYDDATLFDRDLLPKPAYSVLQDRLRLRR